MGIQEIIEQLEACGFTCEAGPIENNEAFIKLRDIAKTDCDSCLDEEAQRQKERCEKCKAKMMVNQKIGGDQSFHPAKLKELLNLTSVLFNKVLTHGRGDGGCSLKPAEIMFVADVFRDNISRWYGSND